MIHKLDAKTFILTDAMFNADDTKIVSVCKFGYSKVWDVETGVLIKEFKNHRGKINSIQFSPKYKGNNLFGDYD